MAEVIVFHHVLGLTSGVHEFAETLRGAGHTVHVPDLYEGRTFDSFDDARAHARTVGFGTLLDRGTAAAEGLRAELVYAGFSLGVMPAQKLAQTRPGATGALLFHACIPVEEFGEAWPAGVPVQVHSMEGDALFVEDGDLDAARALVASARDAELFLYPGDRHLFADASLATYDEPAATLLTERVLTFLDTVR